jgi:hypothetical protein
MAVVVVVDMAALPRLQEDMVQVLTVEVDTVLHPLEDPLDTEQEEDLHHLPETRDLPLVLTLSSGIGSLRLTPTDLERSLPLNSSAP